jgi:hypothetical protein
LNLSRATSKKRTEVSEEKTQGNEDGQDSLVVKIATTVDLILREAAGVVVVAAVVLGIAFMKRKLPVVKVQSKARKNAPLLPPKPPLPELSCPLLEPGH